MIIFKNKVVSVIVNGLLMIWQLPQVIVGLVGLAIFRNCSTYINEDAGIKVWNVNKGTLCGGACFSSGPIIFTSPWSGENTFRHETGHSKQSLFFGPLFLLVVGVPSIILFWYRRLNHKSMDWYYDHWPENSAEKLGHTRR